MNSLQINSVNSVPAGSPATARAVLPPWHAWAGPRKAKVVFIGEAWGESESQAQTPFIGQSGQELWRMLGEALGDGAPDSFHVAARAQRQGLLAWKAARELALAELSWAMTNVLALRPPGNKLDSLCGKKGEVGGHGYSLPPITRGLYLRPEYLPELARLYEEIEHAGPNIIICLGNTACWAVLRATNIGSIRGAVAQSPALLRSQVFPGTEKELPPYFKTLATYHPAGVMRQWSWRPIVVVDLMKALREGEFPQIQRPRRTVLINPTIEECEAWTHETLASPPRLLACDIETGASQIKCVGFARSRDEALVIPFVDLTRKGGSYWSESVTEYRAWRCVARLLESGVPKLFQNGLYDLQYLDRMGFRSQACLEDTMLLHHSLFPEMQKGLGFLGSVYTNEASWKLMRRQAPDTEKRDE